MAIWVSSRVRRPSVRAPAVARLVTRMLRLLQQPQAGVSILFLGDRAMRGLNRIYRRKDTTTDVLAFAVRDAGTMCSPLCGLGDVVVSVPTARRQARAAGHSLDQELTLLLAHGILHLCGYDHERSPQEARRMFRKQAALVTNAGRGVRLCSRTKG